MQSSPWTAGFDWKSKPPCIPEPGQEYDKHEASTAEPPTEMDIDEEPLRKKRREDDSLYIMEINPGPDNSLAWEMHFGDRRREHFGIKIGRPYDVDQRGACRVPGVCPP